MPSNQFRYRSGIIMSLNSVKPQPMHMEKHGKTWRNKYLGDPWGHSVYFRRRTARLSSLQRFRSQRLSRGGWLCHFTVTRQSDGPSQVQSWQKLGRVLLWIADLRCSTLLFENCSSQGVFVHYFRLPQSVDHHWMPNFILANTYPQPQPKSLMQ